MARRKRKVKKVKDDDAYIVDMQIQKDRKGFSLDVWSSEPMEAEEIILTIEQWLNDNILNGLQEPKGPMQ